MTGDGILLNRGWGNQMYITLKLQRHNDLTLGIHLNEVVEDGTISRWKMGDYWHDISIEFV